MDIAGNKTINVIFEVMQTKQLNDSTVLQTFEENLALHYKLGKFTLQTSDVTRRKKREVKTVTAIYYYKTAWKACDDGWGVVGEMCVNCPKGYYSNNNKCAKCPAGFYSTR